MNTGVAFDWEIRISDFAIEREIRKRISSPRNPSSGWISIKKSKSGFHGFPFLLFDCEIRKRICKTVVLNSGVLFAFVNYACAWGRYNSKDSLTFRACFHDGGGPQVGVVTCGELPHRTCKRDPIKMRDYMDRRVTPPRRVTWGPLPPCKEALN